MESGSCQPVCSLIDLKGSLTNKSELSKEDIKKVEAERKALEKQEKEAKRLELKKQKEKESIERK